MAGLSAIPQHKLFRMCSVFHAASARSEKLRFTGWAQTSHSPRSAPMIAKRDKTAVRFFAFAGAAFLRTCNCDLLAEQRISPNQPFKWSVTRQFQTDLSLHTDPTIGARTFLPVASPQAMTVMVVVPRVVV